METKTSKRQKRDYLGDVFGFANSVQCLHPQRDRATCFGLHKIRDSGRPTTFNTALLSPLIVQGDLAVSGLQ